ncbi:hypothetical protein VFPPC_05436 [Pochonia chlamydosporia 170]|uniref:Uncharacterized protein n=1 Tax=Pochonia chlamydosporia 170 TaxID=1380566 RepID=A0A179FFM6_METCM|nr:hypothetical protein VFPPC_05436 [Pochonia chlamydosporia 170]OAQ64100.1 hypothetical protein VFPPC_05436 [Pochonia chlamydosporia 170]
MFPALEAGQASIVTSHRCASRHTADDVVLPIFDPNAHLGLMGQSHVVGSDLGEFESKPLEIALSSKRQVKILHSCRQVGVTVSCCDCESDERVVDLAALEKNACQTGMLVKSRWFSGFGMEWLVDIYDLRWRLELESLAKLQMRPGELQNPLCHLSKPAMCPSRTYGAKDGARPLWTDEVIGGRIYSWHRQPSFGRLETLKPHSSFIAPITKLSKHPRIRVSTAVDTTCQRDEFCTCKGVAVVTSRPFTFPHLICNITSETSS